MAEPAVQRRMRRRATVVFLVLVFLWIFPMYLLAGPFSGASNGWVIVGLMLLPWVSLCILGAVYVVPHLARGRNLPPPLATHDGPASANPAESTALREAGKKG